jgi:hypothetical protein
MSDTRIKYIFLCSVVIKYVQQHVQLNLSDVTFQGNSEIWSHKTSDRLI